MGTGVDGDQLVHIPCCVLVPHVWHSRWVLLLRHHLQVRCGHRDLPDLLCEVKQRGSFAMKRPASSLVASVISCLHWLVVLFLIIRHSASQSNLQFFLLGPTVVD